MPRPVLLVLFGATALALLTGARRDWVGSAACGTCHPRQLAGWRDSAHARSTPDLERFGNSARCGGCHTTGDAPAGRGYFAEVGCEACHGAGAHYAADDVMRNPELARWLGLVDVATADRRRAVCGRCHDGISTRASGLDLTRRVH